MSSFKHPESHPAFTVNGHPVYLQPRQSNGWRGLRLILNPIPEENHAKKSWRLAWNGTRLANSRESEHLLVNRPGLFNDLQRALRERGQSVLTVD